MAEIIQQRYQVEQVEYNREYGYPEDDIDHKGQGYSFPCDKNGEIFYDKLSLPGSENLLRCLTLVEAGVLLDLGRQEDKWTYWVPAIAKCECGNQFELNSTWLNTCDKCHGDHDGNGHRLAPREAWGEETDEHWTDLVNL